MEISQAFDMVLSVPQWQGSGRPQNLARGCLASAEVCQAFGPRFDVPIVGSSATEHGIHNWASLYSQMDFVRRLLDEQRPGRVMTAGGDCAVDVPVIDYLSRTYPDLMVVWVDAHLDANSPDTSPSGNFHGMPVRMILGDTPDALKPLLKNPVDASRFFYKGTRVGDEGEIAFQRKHGLRSLPDDAMLTGPVHVHFDLDVLDPEQFPYLAYAEPGGLGIDAAVELVHRLAGSASLVGFSVTEFAPADDDEAAAGQAVIQRLCRAAAGG